MATPPRVNPRRLTAAGDRWKAEFRFLFLNAFQTPGLDTVPGLCGGSWQASASPSVVPWDHCPPPVSPWLSWVIAAWEKKNTLVYTWLLLKLKTYHLWVLLQFWSCFFGQKKSNKNVTALQYKHFINQVMDFINVFLYFACLQIKNTK